MMCCSQRPEIGTIEYALSISDGNKGEILKFLNYSEDTLFQESAHYLVANMPGKGSLAGLEGYQPAWDSLYYYRTVGNDGSKAIRKFNETISFLRNSGYVTESFNYDLNSVSADFLINNTKQALSSWSRIPEKYRLNFEDFCEYVLPYRVNDEEIVGDHRSYLNNKFEWVYDRLENSVGIEEVVAEVLDSIKIRKNSPVPNKYPVTFNPTQFEILSIGRCTDMVTYAIWVFRSLGIGASADYTPQWGDHATLGHEWLVVHFPDSILIRDVDGNKDLLEEYQKVSFSKIYRKTYELNQFGLAMKLPIRRINKQYVPTYSASLEIISDYNLSENGDFSLCVFNSREVWRKVDFATIENGNISVSGIHPYCVYIVLDESQNPVTHPFEILANDSIHYYKPEGFIPHAEITRKYPIYRTAHRAFHENFTLKWNGASLIGWNHESDSVPMITFSNIYNSQPKHIKIKNNKAFRYYNIRPSESGRHFLAELRLFSKGQEVRPKITRVLSDLNDWAKQSDNLYDADPLTFVGGPNFSLVMDLGKKIPVDEIYFHIRNDDNNIRIGDSYELSVWKGSWERILVFEGTDTIINVKRIPKNGIYWLKNLTRGSEEQLFSFDEFGNQYWPQLRGQDCPINCACPGKDSLVCW
ncbi:hypothetical protein C7460_11940 [Marinoscillum furvescens DSM 4134]|uniref:Transglutaminase superfamily protein n=2 Tax=Marinoscillum furvescens TaxID=1026 RepID=A0A3D9L110_MARFU|nr:hypothetical protein C7460_11940 [Marinoscillum furvescens DSM 4134]